MQFSRRLMPFRHVAFVYAAFAATAFVSLAAQAHDNQPARPSVEASPAPRLITLDDVEGPNAVDMEGWLPYIPQALSDGRNFLEYGLDAKSGKPQFMKVNYQTGAQTPFYDADKMERALAALPAIGPEQAARLAHGYTLNLSADQKRALFSVGGDFFVYDIPLNKAVQITNSPKTSKTNESFSPDGKRLVYVSDNNLTVVDVALDGKKSVPRALTTDGSAGVYNGRLDWVYEEEIYGRGKTTGYKWSSDSRHVAFLRLDEKPMQPFILPDQLPIGQNLEKQWYPKAGDPNPLVSLHIADCEPGAQAASPVYANVKGRPQPVKAKSAGIVNIPLEKYAPNDRLVVRFAWTPSGDKLTYQVQNRIQNVLDLNVFDTKTAKARTLIQEKTPAWVEIIDNPSWLKDGTFLWQSDRTGYRHVYRYKPDGTFVGAVTSGPWDVRDLYGVDEKTGWVYFSGTERSPIGQDICRVKLDGTGYKRLTEKEGTHSAQFDPTFTFFTDRWSDLTTAPQSRVLRADTGAEVRVLGNNPDPARNAARFQMSKPELVSVKARDGFEMNAILLKPTNFDPTKKYPVFCPVYGGPGLQTVRNSWGTVGLSDQMMAEKGYIVWMCDNRSASGRGLQSQWPIYQNMGVSELSDVEDGLNYLKAQPWVDAARIGISGWSFGGFLTEYALTHSKSFKVGVAGAGVSDWHLYDTVYTERYMKTPQENPNGYEITSPAKAAENCSGKLLILHGMMDDNVHLQNSVQMVYGLQKAGKEFEMMFYPSPAARHGIRDPQQSRHLRALQTKFILENL